MNHSKKKPKRLSETQENKTRKDNVLSKHTKIKNSKKIKIKEQFSLRHA